MTAAQIAWQTVCGYLVLAVTYFDYVTSRRPPTCQDPFTDSNDVIFLLDVSSDVSAETFSKYKSYVTEVIGKRIPEVNGTKRFACIMFNEDNSDVIIDNLSGSKSASNYTKVKDVDHRIRYDQLSTSNSTQGGILEATRSVLKILSALKNSSHLQEEASNYQSTSVPVTDSANQKTTNESANEKFRMSVTIFYVTTGNMDNEVIGNVTLLLDEIETLVPEMLAVFGIGVGNFTKSKLEELVRAGNSTCRVKSLQEWWSCLTGEDTSTDRFHSTYVALLVGFVTLNLVVVLLFIVACFQAGRHQAGPKSARNNADSGADRDSRIQMDIRNRPLPTTPPETARNPGMDRPPPASNSNVTQRALPSVPKAGELPPLPESTPETRLKILDTPIQDSHQTRYRPLPGTNYDGRNSPALPRERPSDVTNRPLPTVPATTAPPSSLESASGTLPQTSLIGRNSPKPWTKPSSGDNPAPPMHPPRFPIGQRPADLSRYLPMPRQNPANQRQPSARTSNEPYYVNVRHTSSNYFQLMREDARNKLDQAKRLSRRILSIFAE